MKCIIGLDMGITSVGFASMMLDDNDEPCRIIHMGSRIFEAAENPKDGSSLAAPRRENRSMRRRLRRKRHRKERIKNLIIQNNMMTADEIDAIYNSGKELPDIYKVRAEALDRKLDTEEFVRLLIHLSQRRGFKSNRKVDAKEKGSEAGKLLFAVKSNKELMVERNYRTIGEMLYKDEKFAEFKRNKADDYSNTFARSEYEEEIREIFRAQQEYGNPYATEELKDSYLEIYLSQRSFDEGPGGDSPYAGNQIEKMVGSCTLEPDEKRAAKATFSFLVMSSENRQKGNRIPMQYLDGKRRDDFWLWVGSSNLSRRKKQNLLKETLSDDDLSGFKKRNLQDTQYLSRFMLNYLKKYLTVAPNATGRKAVNGAVTSYMRKRWGIQKVREDGDTHHAVDAVIISCVTAGMTKRISEYAKYKETEYQNPETGEYFDVDKNTGEVINRFPMPYAWFRNELLMRCSEDPSRILHEMPLPNYATDEAVAPIFVSRMPKHKVRGSAHKETIRQSFEEDGKKFTVSKTPLTDLKLKNGEIENYFNPESDVLLYNALKERLIAFGGDAKKAFEAPFHKPKSDGSEGPRACIKEYRCSG